VVFTTLLYTKQFISTLFVNRLVSGKFCLRKDGEKAPSLKRAGMISRSPS